MESGGRRSSPRHVGIADAMEQELNSPGLSTPAVMNAQPDGLCFFFCPNHPVLDVRRDFQPIPRPQVNQPPILKFEPCGSLQKQNEFVPVLVVPAIIRRSMAPGNNPFDLYIFGLNQCFEEFFGQLVRDIGEQVQSFTAYTRSAKCRRVPGGSFRRPRVCQFQT